MNDNTSGALVGAGATALYWWARTEDDRRRRYNELRDDQRAIEVRLNEFLASGDIFRIQLPVVRDAFTGIAEASAGTAAPSPVPNPPSFSRPNTTGGANVPFLQWPPAVPLYDRNGNTNTLGEMAVAFRNFTYQENRAWNQGINLAQAPSANGLMQIFWAANGLSSIVSLLNLTADQYKTAWANLFATVGGSSLAVSHEDPLRSPSAVATFVGLTIVPLTSLNGGPGTYANRNTDNAMRFRVTVPGGGVGAGQAIATITFGAEYRYRDPHTGAAVPFQPAIPLAASNLAVGFCASNITSTGFTLVAKDVLVGGTVHDLTITVVPGIATV